MEGTYEVYFGDDRIGTIRLSRRGLYYDLNCRCRNCGDEMMELVAKGRDFQEKLGILAPVEDGIGLERKIPVKHLREEVLRFFVIPRNTDTQHLVLVEQNEPFPYLQKLQYAYLAEAGDRPVIGFKNNREKR